MGVQATMGLDSTDAEMNKAFDPVLYAKHDPAKHKVIAWLRSKKIVAFVNPDKYGIDIFASRNDDNFEIEVEVKEKWIGKNYPFDTVHISTRKEKFATQNAGVSVWFCLVNNGQTHAVFVSCAEFLTAPTITKNTSCTTSESFREIKTGKVYAL